MGFPSGSDSKDSACKARDTGSIPGLGRSPGEENGYPLQYFWPEIPWTVHAKSLQSCPTLCDPMDCM